METLYNQSGHRLYLTLDERTVLLDAASRAPRNFRTFYEVLHFTGCRISEALSITAERIDFENKAIVFETLKKRRSGVYREVPVPDKLLDTIDLVHGIREKLIKPNELLWSWSRTTAWRKIKELMNNSAISDGPHGSPKGLRHGYGVAAISSGVPLNMLSKWMGHSKIETTAIYANALGQEQRKIAERMWE